MAKRENAVSENSAGSFFVDDTCIDCDTCRQVAPLTFMAADGHSAVYCQPTSPEEIAAAAQAIICCPTASIGCDEPAAVKSAQHAFPQKMGDGIWYNGWTSRLSFGASSYLVQHGDELWMIDAPRWSPALVTGIERIGTVTGIFLTHRDDVADAQRYAAHFSAPRFIHERDADAVPDAEHIISGDNISELTPGLTCIPVPGHTAGSIALLTSHGALFSGDHLWWSPRRQQLNASKAVCWHNWEQQIASMVRLQEFPITHLFPGHGRRYHTTAAQMRTELGVLITRMQSNDPDAWP